MVNCFCQDNLTGYRVFEHQKLKVCGYKNEDHRLCLANSFRHFHEL